jgi:hypothetical protein
MELSVFFPRLSESQLEVMTKKVDYVPQGAALNVKANEECNVICPYDDDLGERPNIISKVMDPNTNPLEKDRLLATLQRLPTSKRNNLSDEELALMLPSRYNQTLTDDAAFAEHLSHVVDDYSETDNQGNFDSSVDKGTDGDSTAVGNS